MRCDETGIAGAWLIAPDTFEDARGVFVHLHVERELAARGVTASFVRTALSRNRHAGTLRGMHLQVPPNADAKLVTCVQGRVHDVIVDTRRASATFGQWRGFALSGETPRLIYIPEGVAHGFLTLADDTLVLYHLSAYYVPESSTGFRWDDPAVAIAWPAPVTVISDQDRAQGTLADLARFGR